jgi:glutamate carboxypeptidase
VNDRFLSRLAELCGIDSFTGDIAGVDRAVHVLARWATEAGLEVELVPSPDGLHLIASTQGAGHGRVLFIGHHDTVFPPPIAIERPVTVVGDRVLGPGVADMKGGVLVALEALERLAADPGGPHGRIELHCVPDEEARSIEPLTLDRMRGADAALCFECGRASGAIVTVRKAGTWLDLFARGRAAHAGTEPHEGRSALMALVQESIRIRKEIDGARPGLTANITWFHSGDVKNTIPDRAEATVDVRALTSGDLDWAFERIGEFAAHDGVEVRRSDDRGFPAMERAGWLADRTLEILAELGQPALEEMAGGVSDGSWTSQIGIPTVDGMGPAGALDHTDEEYIEVASVEPRIEATVRLCGELGRRIS